MALYVYSKIDGALYSWSPEDDGPVAGNAGLAAVNLAVVTGLPALDETHVWDAASKAVVPVPARVKPVVILTGLWVMRFTPDEFAAINTSADPAVKQMMYAVGRTTELNLANPLVIDGINYFASIGLIAPNRVATILGGA